MNKIAIYGTGTFGKLFLKSLNNKVDFFIDDYDKKNQLHHIPIIELSIVQKNTTIYISPLKHSKKIEKELLAKGYTNIINFTDSIKKLPNILKLISYTNYLWLVDDKYQIINKHKIKLFKNLLVDTKSKKILEAILSLRKTLDTTHYINPTDTEYFPSDVPILKNLDAINFIDCGAYTGDTIEVLCQQSHQINSTVSFEPNLSNLEKLNTTLEKLKLQNPKINFLTYPVGVYKENTILGFTSSGIDSSTSIDHNSSIGIPVVSLDSTIYNANPNFIKMDIEGAEIDALIGAEKTIQKYKPNLAICLYHKPEDLWEIPLLIHKIEPSYDMYIRVHEDMCLSTVLYCISKERNV
ncbi:FkbM family methyltransferase [Sulfurimonas sp. SAG-AH-194-C21]|nr:FkbM family methyltransferase [Sulfurimonas sp. SAG-AH-194-C21]MDF1884391.1 FkbM family methyltransferase [Sulfurimonas sp. SAG-AH-194-C21]